MRVDSLEPLAVAANCDFTEQLTHADGVMKVVPGQLTNKKSCTLSAWQDLLVPGASIQYTFQLQLTQLALLNYSLREGIPQWIA